MIILSAELIDRLGIALLHSLWQGSLVGLALLVVLLMLRRATSQARYLASCTALLVMLALPVGTLWIARPTPRVINVDESVPPSRLVTSAAAALEVAASLLPAEFPENARTSEPDSSTPNSDAPPSAEERHSWLSSPARHLLTAIVAAWGCGVVLLAIKTLGGYVAACRLARRQIEPLEALWQARFEQLALRLRVARPVEIWQSACIQSPVVIGAFRPVVLVPFGIITGLSVAQIEAILAHELAHIRRYDFLVNAVQCVLETLLFYHPCAWWISARIRAEREHCCDDLAVAACGDSLMYARALSSLEELRSPAQLALALSGGGSLLSRVRRIVGQRRAGEVVGGWFAGSLAIVIPMAVGVVWSSGRNDLNLQNASGAESQIVASEERAASDESPLGAEEALFRDAVRVTSDLTQTLAAVTDASTAAAAAEKIVELSRQHADVERRLRELRRAMSPKTTAQLENRWISEIEDSSKRLRAEVARVEQVPGAVDALHSSVLFAVIGLNRKSPTAEPSPATVDFLVPSGAPRPHFGWSGDPLERMLKENGPERIVKVVVLGLPGDVYAEVYNRLQHALPNLGYFGSGAGDTATVYLSPVSDIDFFAAQINFGEVISIDHATRVITVRADHARLARTQSAVVAAGSRADDQEASDLVSLGKRLLRHDHSAVNDLIALGAEAQQTAMHYAAHADRLVRRDALLVLKKIGSAESLPVAIQALSDSDVGNRDLAWQSLCRVPGALARREVIAAAAAGMERDAEQAAKWLSDIGPAAEGEVMPYLRHDIAAVRRHAATVLRTIGGPDSLTSLQPMLDDSDHLVARAARLAHEAISARLSSAP